MAKDSTDLKKAMFQVSDGVLGAAILVFLGVIGGQWLDTQLKTSPWCMIVFSILGGGLGLGRLVQKAMQIGAATNTSETKQVLSTPPAITELPEAELLSKEKGKQPRSPYQKWDDEDQDK